MTTMAGLSPRAVSSIRDVERHLARGDVRSAEHALPAALVYAGGHASVQRLAARVAQSARRFPEAVSILRDLVRAAPDDIDALAALAAMQLEGGFFDDAAASWAEVCARRPSAAAWLEYGVALDQSASTQQALEVVDKVLAIEPGHARARLLRARVLQALGDTAGTASEYRRLIADGHHVAAAWFALLDIKTVALDEAEVESLARFAGSPKRTPEERTLLDFALARVHEGVGDYAAAAAALDRANASVRSRSRWDARAHHAYVDRLLAEPVAQGDASRGSEVIFIVGLPRSGSTLLEQILAAHPSVEGASELPDLQAVIATESRRRGRTFPEWVRGASPADWQRLGDEYLARTARWRTTRPVSTDKAPENWQYAGVIAAMLPGARIVDSRRDAVETCWSCYKQLFAPGRVEFTYSLDDLAAYWSDYLRASAHWSRSQPSRYRVFRYDDLLADTEATTRALLAFCGLDFDEACLDPRRAMRAIRTSSSAQVREGLDRGTARGNRYGPVLDILRAKLGEPAWQPRGQR